MIKKSICLAFFFFIFFLSGCNSIKGNLKVAEELDYSDQQIVENEKKRILQYLQEEPVKALWRAKLLGDEKIIQHCYDVLLLKFNEAIEKKEFFDAQRYFISLKSTGYYDLPYSQKDVDALIASDVPGQKIEKSKLPKTISDCINATMTVWVDRGLKIQNGSGYSDIVIGSAFFIDKRGYAITNHHVIESMVDSSYEGFSRLYVKLPSDPDTKIPAKVIGYDSILDLALIKVEIEPQFILELGSSSQLSIGDKVSAIGTPIGLEGTLTSGIISSVERKLQTLGNVFQIDAAVNSGNSGGPLIDENRRVQAIVFAGMPRYQGLNFAIPVEFLKQELPLLYYGGELNHTWTGAYGKTKRNGKKKEGLEIHYLMPGGSGKISGLIEEDIIYELSGKTISSIEDFQFECMKYEPGTILECKFIRNDEKKSLLLYLDKRPENPLIDIYNSDFISNVCVPFFGMKLVCSSTVNRNSYTIEKVYKGTTADQIGFSEFDQLIITDIKFDSQNQVFYAQLYTKRRKKGFIDMNLVIASSYDCPYYF